MIQHRDRLALILFALVCLLVCGLIAIVWAASREQGKGGRLPPHVRAQLPC